MQPCSGEMQGINSLLTNGGGNEQQQQQQQSHQHQQIHHQNAQFDPTSQDDFLEQMLSSLPSCSWTDLKSPWVDLNPNAMTTAIKNSRDLSDETAPCSQENVGFQFDESMILASKMRQHQISNTGGGSNSAAAAAKLMMQQQQQMIMAVAARGGMGLPLTLGNGAENDIVDGTSFKSQVSPS